MQIWNNQLRILWADNSDKPSKQQVCPWHCLTAIILFLSLWVICSQVLIIDIHGEMFLNLIHVMSSRLIRPSRNSYNDLPVSFRSITKLYSLKRSLFKYLISLTFFFFFSFFSVLALNVKHFAQNDLDCQIKYY